MKPTTFFATLGSALTVALLALAFSSSANANSSAATATADEAASTNAASSKVHKASASSEAKQMLRSIADSARAYRMDSSNFNQGMVPMPPSFPSSTASTPAASCCASGGLCTSDKATWSSPEWQALNFSIEGEHRFAYRVETSEDGSSFIATATADLNCDGNITTFEVRGSMSGGDPVLSDITEL